MENIPLIGQIVETLNILTITTPFFVGYLAYNWGNSSGEGHAIPTIVALLSFIGLVAVWYALYQWIEFPLWMGWFN